MTVIQKTIFTFLLVLFYSSSILSQELIFPLRIAYHENGVPWAWKGTSGKPQGILVDIANEALVKRMNVSVSYHFYPWKRAQYKVEIGDMDALFTNYTLKRQAYTVAGNEFITNVKRMIFINKNDSRLEEIANVRTLDELSAFTIGSYIGNQWIDKNLGGMVIIRGNNANNALKMLSVGRFDVYLGNPMSTQYKIKKIGINNIIMLPNSLEDIKPSQFRLLIRKDSPHIILLPLFDKTIRSMKGDGTLNLIFDQYR